MEILCRHEIELSIVKFEDVQIAESLQVFSDDLVRNVYECHIPKDERVAIKSHCFSSLKATVPSWL